MSGRADAFVNSHTECKVSVSYVKELTKGEVNEVVVATDTSATAIVFIGRGSSVQVKVVSSSVLRYLQPSFYKSLCSHNT